MTIAFTSKRAPSQTHTPLDTNLPGTHASNRSHIQTSNRPGTLRLPKPPVLKRVLNSGESTRASHPSGTAQCCMLAFTSEESTAWPVRVLVSHLVPLHPGKQVQAPFLPWHLPCLPHASSVQVKPHCLPRRKRTGIRSIHQSVPVFSHKLPTRSVGSAITLENALCVCMSA
jgi:hypothetical protein